MNSTHRLKNNETNTSREGDEIKIWKTDNFCHFPLSLCVLRNAAAAASSPTEFYVNFLFRIRNIFLFEILFLLHS